MSTRYEVRGRQISQEYRDRVRHLDTELDKMVPFGQFSDRDRAQRRANRMNDRNEEQA